MLRAAAVVIASQLLLSEARAEILPPNERASLPTRDVSELTERDQQRFEALVEQVVVNFQATVSAYGGTLSKQTDWSSQVVNATARIVGNQWVIIAWGGLFRVEGMTDDGFQLAICHEAGHLMGGFPFYTGSIEATSEGQADYFAAHVCARKIWHSQQSANRAAYDAAAPALRAECDAQWSDDASAHLCARIAAGGEHLIATLSPDSTLGFDTPDRSVAPVTLYNTYPAAQCRVDTFVRGAMCADPWDFSVIPGRAVEPRNSVQAEAEAHRQSCHRLRLPDGARPACWYHQRVDLRPDGPNDP